MGGERRRRRLRRGGRSPGGEPPAESAPDGSAGPFDTAAASCGTPSGADHGLEAAPPGSAATAPATAQPDTDTAQPNIDTAQPNTEAPRAARRGVGPRGTGPRPAAAGAQHRPSPADLAELAGPFALTAGVQDPEPAGDQPIQQSVQHGDDPAGERGLRGLVGGGSSQVNVAAAMRARDASRPSDEHLAAAEADLPIVRRGWVPRDELPRPGAH